MAESKSPDMYIGVDYYPEHWPRSRWEKDADLMRRAGFNIVRLAEFAWGFMEPRKGVYRFEWLDEILGILDERGIKAILGTPTGAMPAWMAHEYPDVLQVQPNGNRVTWGVRKNNCFSSPAYRAFSRGITMAMTRHFARNPAVIGWQTDNEFGVQFCYCDACRAGFHHWLAQRYGTLELLNRSWGTHFWGQIYSAWEQIPLPDNFEAQNPSLCLDWQRFNSWQNTDFQAAQVAIIRRQCPRHFVTHNFMGLYSEINYYDLAKDLDFVAWDNYPVWGAPATRYDASAAADVMRGLKRRNFWIMEQTAGPGGWSSFGRNPRPGEIRSVSFQQVAHGADAIVWFRWRSCTAGREQYWHGLLGHDGVPGRRYREAAATARDLRSIAPALEGTTVRAEAAFIYDYECHWALKIQPGFSKNNYHDALRRYHRALFRAGVNVDMVPPGADLRRYKLVIAPDLVIMPDRLARRIDDYIRRGGVFLADHRCGVKDQTNLCHARTIPGLLGPALGIRIDEYESLPAAIEVEGRGSIKGRYTAVDYADWLATDGAETLARYTGQHLIRFAAATRHRHGRGCAYYVGTVFNEESFYDKLAAALLAEAGIKPVCRPPIGVEASVREGAGKRLLFLVNHSEAVQSVVLPRRARDLITGRLTGASIELQPHGVCVLDLAARRHI